MDRSESAKNRRREVALKNQKAAIMRREKELTTATKIKNETMRDYAIQRLTNIRKNLITSVKNTEEKLKFKG